MNIILGATGHVGSSVARNLLKMGEDVTVVTRSPRKKADWKGQGAEVKVADIFNTKELKEVFNKGDRLFLLNPPASPSANTVKVEKESIQSILEALKDSPIKKVVAESTMGAQPGEGLGDLGVLYEMEKGLEELGIEHSIIRAAYYMSNWDSSFQTAQDEGVLYSFFPGDFKLPMVAPDDIGEIAAELLREDSDGIHYVEGPEMYSPNDVAQALSHVLNKKIKVVTIKKEDWVSSLQKVGFSQIAAESMAKMTEITLDEKYAKSKTPRRGKTTLNQYFQNLAEKISA